MSGVAVALSFVLVQVDVWLGVGVVQKFGLLYTFGPEGARAILSVIASSMITVASVIFSITMLTLQLASSQFGPRVLRNFMRDRSNQIVLGTFIATFLYCLLVLRTVRGTDNSSFVPHLSVAFGALLAIASVAVLIYFIHHIADRRDFRGPSKFSQPYSPYRGLRVGGLKKKYRELAEIGM